MVVIDTFEGADNWWTFNGATKSFGSTPAPQEGLACMKANYSAFPSSWAGWGLDLSQDWTGNNALFMYMYGDGSNLLFHVDIKDADNEVWVFEFMVFWTGWRAVRLPFSQFFRTSGGGDNQVTLTNIQYIQFAVKQPGAASYMAFDHVRVDYVEMPAYVIDDFESAIPSYTVWGSGSPRFEAAQQPFAGSYSGKFSYNVAVSANGANRNINADWSAYDHISLCLAGDGSSNYFVVKLVDNDNEHWRKALMLDFTGWRKLRLKFEDFDRDPDNGNQAGNNALDLSTVKQIQFIVPTGSGAGYYYLDEVRLGKGVEAAAVDVPWRPTRPLVVGWYPDWNELDMPFAALHRTHRLLTHLSPCWYRLNCQAQDGTLINTEDLVSIGRFGTGVLAQKSRTIEFCRMAGLPIMPLLSSYDAVNDASGHETIEAILDSATKRSTLIEAIYNECVVNKWAGVNVDFEGFSGAYRDKMNGFMADLFARFTAAGLMVTIDVPPKTSDAGSDWSAWADYKALAACTHYIIVMCYDQHGAWDPANPGSVGGLSWVQSVINYCLSKVPERQLVMGIGTYAYDWNITDTTAVYASWQEMNALMIAHGLTPSYPAPDLTPRISYTDATGDAHEAHFEDAASVAAKIGFARARRLAGVAFWRLDLAQGEGYPDSAGFDDTMAYWDAVRKLAMGPDENEKAWL